MEKKNIDTVRPGKDSYRWILSATLVLVIVLTLAWYTIKKIEIQIKKDSASTLTALLNVTNESINIWFADRKRDIVHIASLSSFKHYVNEQLKVERTRKDLKMNDSLRSLREYTALEIQSHHDLGFFVISPDYINIASLRDSNLGERNILSEYGNYLERIFKGETVLTMPIPSKVKLPGDDGKPAIGVPTMFVGTPVTYNGKIIAAFLFRINPSVMFTNIIQRARPGESGDIYAFDRLGRFISEPRFAGELRGAGLISGQSAILNLTVSDPGKRLKKGDMVSGERGAWPLTIMAGDATLGHSGINLEGYRDYRGVQVAGAWRWNENLGFALTVEINLAEVYASLNIIRRTVGLVIGLIMILFSGFIVLIIIRNRKLDAVIIECKRVEGELRRYHDIVDQSADSLFILDAGSAAIVDVNESTCTSLGVSRERLLNMSMFDISSYLKDMAVWKECISKLGQRAEISLETEHLRADGTYIPVEVRAKLVSQEDMDYLVLFARDIRERKEAGAELKKLQIAVEQSPAAVIITNVSGSIEYANNKFCDITGYTVDEVIGRNPRILKSGFQSDDFYNEMWSTITSGREWRGNFHNKRKDGKYFWESAIISPIKDEQGIITHFVALKEDITLRKKVEEKLRTLSLVVDQSPAATIILNTDLRINYVNPACVESFGYSADELVGEKISKLYSDEHTGEFFEAIWATAATGEIWRGDICSLRSDGVKVWELISISPVLDSDGEVTHFVSVKVDDTERKKAEDSLKTSEAMLREAQKIAQMGHWELDISNDSLYWSDEVFRIFEIDPDELEASYEAFIKTIHPDDREFVTSAYADSLAKKTGYDIVHRLLMKDERVKYVHEICETDYNAQGEPVRSIGMVQDITAISTAEEALRTSEAQQRLILNSTAEAIYGLDLKGNCTLANKACVKILGYESVDDLVGENMHDLIHHTRRDGSAYLEKECRVHEAFFEGKDTHADDEVFWRKDKTSFDAEYWSHPLRKDSKLVGSVVTFLDISERKMLETEVIKAQKLESIGLLAGGIAHDFNNLLTSIVGNVDFAKQLCNPGEKIFERLEKVQMASTQATALTKQLLTFSKGGDPIMMVVSVVDIVKESLDISLKGSHIIGDFDAPDDLALVYADSGQISQVLNNLIINASQAMPDGGKVVISCKDMHIRSSGELILKGGDYVKITVRDNGSGIKEEDLKRIFDPYFTTKKTGTGLGLATTYSIINNHGGMINVRSTVGKGTVFDIYLPAIDTPVETKEKGEDKVVKGHGRILVMDDDEGIGDYISLALETCGYRSRLVFTGEEALEEYKAALDAGDPYDAVIIDLVIKGGVGGKETIIKLKEIDPDVVGIVSSGYSNDPAMIRYEEFGFKGSLAKPYKVTGLSKVIESVVKKKK